MSDEGHNTYHELDFIRNIGTYSTQGQRAGKLQCLIGYQKALDFRYHLGLLDYTSMHECVEEEIGKII